MQDKDYKYPRVKWRLPWPCWIGIAMFVGGILVILLFSSPEIDYIASLCSVGGLLITAILAGFDYSNRTVVDMMREDHGAMMEILERGREEHKAMAEDHKAMAEDHKAMIEALKEITNSLRRK